MACRGVRIGDLRHRLAIRSGTPSQGNTGEVTYSWSTDSTVWGSLTPLSGKELESARQIFEEVTYKAIIRYNSSITTENRILFDSRTFEIITIMNQEEKNIYQVLMLKEIT